MIEIAANADSAAIHTALRDFDGAIWREDTGEVVPLVALQVVTVNRVETFDVISVLQQTYATVERIECSAELFNCHTLCHRTHDIAYWYTRIGIVKRRHVHGRIIFVFYGCRHIWRQFLARRGAR